MRRALRRDEATTSLISAAARSNDIVNYGLGDWYDLGPKQPGVSQLTPIALTATAFYYYDAGIMRADRRAAGQAEDAKQFSELAEKIRAAFNEKFYNADRTIFTPQIRNAPTPFRW